MQDSDKNHSLEQEKILEILNSNDSRVRYGIYNNLLSGDKAFAANIFMGLIQLEDIKEELGREAVWQLRKIGRSKEVELLINLLKETPDVQIKVRAAHVLGLLKATEAMEVLLVLLNDENFSLRVTSATALSEIGDRKTLEPLLARFYKSTEYERDNLIDVLASFDDEGTLNLYLEILASAKSDKELYMIESLGIFTHCNAYNKLVDLLSSRDIDIQAAAIKGLGHYCDLQALPLLQPFLINGDEKDSEGDTLRYLAEESILRLEVSQKVK